MTKATPTKERLMQVIAFDPAPTALAREWLTRSHWRMRRNSAWGNSGNHSGSGPSIHRLLWRLIGHLISSFLVFVTLLVLTWELEAVVMWLDARQPFSDEELKVISTLKTAMLYFDAIVSAYVLLSGALTFLKGERR